MSKRVSRPLPPVPNETGFASGVYEQPISLNAPTMAASSSSSLLQLPELDLCTVQVKNLPDHYMSEEKLEMFFESKTFDQVPSVKTVLLVGKNEAEVTFENPEDASFVLQKHRETPCVLKGERLTILPMAPPTPVPENMYSDEYCRPSDVRKVSSSADVIQRSDEQDDGSDDFEAVEVTGFTDDVTDDCLRYYFENTHRSGGGEIKAFSRSEGYAYVTFEDKKAARNVVRAEHTLQDCKLYVSPAAINKTALSFKNLPEDIGEDDLDLFLEAKLRKDVANVVISKCKGAAVVQFKSPVEFSNVADVCASLRFKGKNLEVNQVTVSRSIVVYQLPKGVTHDSVLFYFENTKRSGGGAVQRVDADHLDDGYCLVHFKDNRVAERVCEKKDHMLGSVFVQVAPYHRQLGLPEKCEAAIGPKICSFHIEVGLYDPYKLKYFIILPAMQEKLNEKLKVCSASVVSWENQITVECTQATNNPEFGELKNWEETAKKVIDIAFDSVKVEQRSVNSEMWSSVKDGLRNVTITNPDLVALFMEYKNGMIILVGEASVMDSTWKQVLANIEETEKVYKSSKETVSSTVSIKHYKAKYLMKSCFEKVSQQTYGVRMEFQGGNGPHMDITLTGNKKNVDDCTLKLYTEIENIESKKIPLELEHTRLLKREDIQKAVTKEMNRKNLTDVWDILDDYVILYTKERDDFEKMETVIVNAVTKVVVPLDKHALEAVLSEKWKKVESGLRSECKSCLEVRVDDKRMELCGFTTPAMADAVQDALEEFQSKNAVYTDRLSVDAPKANFIKRHMQSELSAIKKSLVKMEINNNGCVEIQGTSASTKSARKSLTDLADKILTKAHGIEESNIKQYFACNKGKECIQKAESHGPCVIEMQGSGFAKSIRIGKSDGRKMTFERPTQCAEVTVNGTKILVMGGDITELKCDVLVNAANRTLRHRGGLARIIQEKGGDEIAKDSEKRIQQKGEVKDGEVYMGVPGKLGCRAVAHAVGPQWKGGRDGEDKLLRNAVVNCLRKSEKRKLKTIAFPALCAGMFNYPIDLSCKEIINAIDGYLKDHKIHEIILCDISENTVKAFCDALLAQYPSTNILLKVGETGSVGQINIHEVESRPSSGRSRTRREHDTSDKRAFGKLTVEVVKSALANEQVDVIVNSASADLKLNKGRSSKALSEAAGKGLQRELDSKYPQGIQPGREVASTPAFKLPCKGVYHVAVKHYSSQEDLKGIEYVVSESLKLADKDGHASIAFPAIGTGGQKYPLSDVAQTMLSSVAWFSRHYKKSSVRTVRIVIYHRDDDVYQAFVDALGTAQGASGGSSSASAVPSNASNPVQIGGLNVTVVEGDITSERVDAIVASCNKELDLDKGQVTKIIRTKAGNALLQDSNFRKDIMKKDGLVMTVGGNLPAKNVIFVETQSNPSAWQPLILAALRKAEDGHLHSISFPALGTNYGCKPVDVGIAMRSAIDDFNKHIVKNLKEVRIVAFKADMVDDFVHGLNQTGARPTRRRSRSPVQEDRPMGPRNTDDHQVQLTIYSSNNGGIERAIKSIKQTIKDEWIVSNIHDSCVRMLNNKQIKQLEVQAANNHVNLTIDQKKEEIVLVGLIGNVSNMKDHVHLVLRNADKHKHDQENAELLQSVVQWVFIKEHKTVAFDKTSNQLIEQAFGQKQKSINFKLVRREYTIDFDKMKEWDVTNPGTKYSVLRRDLRNETKLDIPSHWSAIKDPAQVECVALSKSDKEYSKVEQEFTATIGQRVNIVMIERIQNATLYTQYQAKKKQMQTSRKSKNVELVLWHGTAQDAVKSINAHGFNRSYCGKNATAFGQGVYFAMSAAYSAQPKYSPADGSGNKRMYRCLVLTGEHTRGDPSMRVPPPKNPTVPHVLYDSVTDNPGSPSMFVIFNDTQAYPEHLITFK